MSRSGTLGSIDLTAKRALDAGVSLVALVVLAPVLAVIAVLVGKRLGRPILFVQERPGLHGRLFRLYKFRTMRDARGPDGAPLPDSERLTRFGETLRALSVDELPELVNVLKGDMSLVGPRPLLPEYLPRYDQRQARRHEVRPGLTGWAQVNGRNELSWPERLELDVWYVEHRSLLLDLRILVRTVYQVLRREGIQPRAGVTMPPFMTGDAPAPDSVGGQQLDGTSRGSSPNDARGG